VIKKIIIITSRIAIVTWSTHKSEDKYLLTEEDECWKGVYLRRLDIYRITVVSIKHNVYLRRLDLYTAAVFSLFILNDWSSFTEIITDLEHTLCVCHVPCWDLCSLFLSSCDCVTMSYFYFKGCVCFNNGSFRFLQYQEDDGNSDPVNVYQMVW